GITTPAQPTPWRGFSFSGGRMRVLVTGGAGYIGSHTAKVLAHSGFEPIVLDNLSTGHRWAVKWGPLVEGDLGDSTLIREVIKTYRVQAVVHFAGFAYVGESMRRPRQYFRNNVTYTLRQVTLFHSRFKRLLERIRRLRFTGRTTPPRTALPSATTRMLWTWPRRTLQP